MKTEYRIVGRFAKDDKKHVVDRDPKWTKADAEKRLKEIMVDEERAKRQGAHVQTCGCIGISTKYDADYALMDLKIESREVSPWA